MGDSLPQIVVPSGKSAAERRLSAIGALHQPVPAQLPGFGPSCSECNTRWPCATAKLCGPWPGEPDDNNHNSARRGGKR
ncbi:hypothetical protein [Mycobacteroides abscessus]|uniref:hypothetical protein n=1 Tax=Mycobacteroides abscessus TaxID=36809 RepID=UPI00266C04F6|nr:hypothetical protein [Mycobacteroides abscessus]MDO3331395.1 hypothetical protein [Mycobacteroides abscessus subsp. abscessus]